MEAFNRIHPGSLIGMPMNPFPPGVGWSSRREMLYEVMADLHRIWVQDFFFKQDAGADARILSSPAQLSKSCSFTFSGRMDADSAHPVVSFDLVISVLLVPAFTRDEISTGVSVETHAGGVPFEIVCRNNRFVHYVRNNRTGAMCTVSVDNEMEFVEVCFFTRASAKSNSVHLQLKFKGDLFAKAFASGSVDFDLLEQGILTMAVGYSARGPTGCKCQNESCVECVGIQALRPHVSPHKASFADYIHCGDYFSKSVLSFYEGSVLQNAIPVFSFTSRNFGAPDSSVDKMFNWGMADRLGRLKPIPPPVIPFSVEDLDQRGPIEEFTDLGVGSSAHDVDNILLGIFSDVVQPPLPRAQEQQLIASEQDETGPHQISGLPRESVWTITPEALSNASGDRVSMGSSPVQCLPSVNGPPHGVTADKGVVRIAPAPSVDSKPSAEQIAAASLMYSMEQERLAKLEKRKISKREAAFRSNAKRTERRRKARLAKQSSNEVP